MIIDKYLLIRVFIVMVILLSSYVMHTYFDFSINSVLFKQTIVTLLFASWMCQDR